MASPWHPHGTAVELSLQCYGTFHGTDRAAPAPWQCLPWGSLSAMIPAVGQFCRNDMAAMGFKWHGHGRHPPREGCTILVFFLAFMAVPAAVHGACAMCFHGILIALSWHSHSASPSGSPLHFVDFHRCPRTSMSCHGPAMGFHGTDCHGSAMKAPMTLPWHRGTAIAVQWPCQGDPIASAWCCHGTTMAVPWHLPCN